MLNSDSSPGPERLTLDIDWAIYARNKVVVRRLITELGKRRRGLFLAAKDGTVEFYEHSVLLNQAQEGNAFLQGLLPLYDKTMGGDAEAGFKPESDVILAMTENTIVTESIAGQTTRVRAWWARPTSKTVLLINLDADVRIVQAKITLA